MRGITGAPAPVRYLSSPAAVVRREGRRATKGDDVKRAIKSHGLWLTVTYVGLLLLIAKGYAG